MNKAFVLRKEDRAPQWRHINAEGEVLGRMATKIADILRGKDKPYYTPNADCGDYVVVTNAEKVVLTGDKWKLKEYVSYSGWLGGQKVLTAEQLKERDPAKIIERAVERMLPKNKLNREIYKKLKVYAGTEHPHKAQIQASDATKAA